MQLIILTLYLPAVAYIDAQTISTNAFYTLRPRYMKGERLRRELITEGSESHVILEYVLIVKEYALIVKRICTLSVPRLVFKYIQLLNI